MLLQILKPRAGCQQKLTIWRPCKSSHKRLVFGIIKEQPVRLLLNFDILRYLIIVLAQMRCIRISFLYNLIGIIIKYFASLLFGRQLLLRLSNITHIISTVFIFKIFSLLYGELVEELLLIL